MGLYFFLVAGINIFWVNTLPLVVETPFCFVAQVGLNTQSSCFSLLNAGVTDMCHHADFMKKNNLLIISENWILSIKKHLFLWLCCFYNRLPEICTLNESLKKNTQIQLSLLSCVRRAWSTYTLGVKLGQPPTVSPDSFCLPLLTV